MTNKISNAVIYTRVASLEQANDNAIISQLNECKKYAQEHNITVLSHVDESGKKSSNSLETLLNNTKESKEEISYIIVYDLNRLSRSNEIVAAFLAELKKLNISILTVKNDDKHDCLYL
ncbi:MAG TPA: recombinase family protein [Cytophagaceae bacterium]|jgi:DNA invertase Pin-like site-specific DNA recombinase|nr:recombinase family protein [Cytophagaceae bacterium]